MRHDDIAEHADEYRFENGGRAAEPFHILETRFSLSASGLQRSGVGYSADGRRARSKAKEAAMSTSYRGQSALRWLFRSGTSVCWVPSVPKLSNVGDIVLEAEGGFIKMFLDWIAAFIRGSQRLLTGELVCYDLGMAEQERWAFTSAVIRSLAFPTLDAALDVAGRMTITARALSVKSLPASKSGAPLPLVAMPWRCRDFSVTIAGLNTSKVSHVDAMTLTTPGASSDIRILVPESTLPQFLD